MGKVSGGASAARADATAASAQSASPKLYFQTCCIVGATARQSSINHIGERGWGFSLLVLMFRPADGEQDGNQDDASDDEKGRGSRNGDQFLAQHLQPDKHKHQSQAVLEVAEVF